MNGLLTRQALPGSRCEYQSSLDTRGRFASAVLNTAPRRASCDAATSLLPAPPAHLYSPQGQRRPKGLVHTSISWCKNCDVCLKCLQFRNNFSVVGCCCCCCCCLFQSNLKNKERTSGAAPMASNLEFELFLDWKDYVSSRFMAHCVASTRRHVGKPSE